MDKWILLLQGIFVGRGSNIFHFSFLFDSLHVFISCCTSYFPFDLSRSCSVFFVRPISWFIRIFLLRLFIFAFFFPWCHYLEFELILTYASLQQIFMLNKFNTFVATSRHSKCMIPFNCYTYLLLNHIYSYIAIRNLLLLTP